MIKFFVVLLFLLGIFPYDCPAVELEKELASHRQDTYTGDLGTIKSKRFLRVLTTNSSINYFIYNGEEKGYEYEIVKAFVEYLNRLQKLEVKGGLKIKFEMIPVRSDQLIPMLEDGYGDIAAAGLTITHERKAQVRFASPYNRVNEVIVTGGSNTGIKKKEDLSGRMVAVRKSSSYYESLVDINSQLTAKGLKPIRIVKVDEELATVEIMELVALGRYDMTVADSHIAELAVQVFDGLRIIPGLVIRDRGEIAWAVHEKSGKLLDELNRFIPTYKKGSLLGNIGIKKYFKNIGRIKNRYFNRENGRISPYDDLFKKYGDMYNLDWRLLAALGYQESRFKQKGTNRWGAIGIMQIKAATASEKYVNISQIEGEGNADGNIHAGVKYLAWIKKRYFDREDILQKDRIRFALAAYNAGPRTVARARKKAGEAGLDPNRWFRNVELAMLRMKKTEPVNYVSDINKRFISYSLLGF